jgi:hypothetical protein
MPWFLDFGILFHQIVEDIYTWKQEDTYDNHRLAEHISALWTAGDYEWHMQRQDKAVLALGGLPGLIALGIQYTEYYNRDTERLRMIGTEITFGKKREVLLGSFVVDEEINIDCYLTGRIDFMMDSGHKIGPMDHKTRSYFKGDLGAAYNPQEGMTGYIFATKQILKHNFPELYEKKQVDTCWMNFVQVQSEPDPLKRFKRIPIMRTEYQLEEFRLRQLSTFEQIFRMMYFDQRATWDTEKCAHWFGFNDCMYRKVHRQPDLQSQLVVLQTDFQEGSYWNPEKEESDVTVSSD